MRIHRDGTLPLRPDTVFVFGSNLSGIHGAGAAKVAYERFGAAWGQGIGLHGNSYALPTKDENIRTLPLPQIIESIEEFNAFVASSDRRFFLTRFGCQLAGYKDEEIAPWVKLFKNCSYPTQWEPYIRKRK